MLRQDPPPFVPSPLVNGAETGPQPVLTLIGRLVMNGYHARSSEGGLCRVCVPRPEPIRRRDAHVPQDGRL
jgi:hypothetical protein